MNLKESLEEYKRTECEKCNNKNSNLCHITINIEGKPQCVYRETINKEVDNE